MSHENSGIEHETSRCPFCGSDATDWDTDLCRDLIADFGDRSNGDRGIMCGSGGSRCGNAALDCLNDVERTLIEFADVVSPSGYSDEGLTDAEEASLMQALGFGDQAPSWLPPVFEPMEYGDRPNEATVEDIWYAAVPWSDRLVLTSRTLGYMASSTWTYVWAADPVEGARDIAKAMRDVDLDIRNALERLRGSGWRRAGAAGVNPLEGA